MLWPCDRAVTCASRMQPLRGAAAAAAPKRWWLANSTAPLLAPAYAAHQRSVPRLPIPPLGETLERYLRAAQPLQTLEEHAATRAAVAQFFDTDGPGLQRLLEEADAALPHDSSYLESLWYRLAYLGPRSPVPIHANPCFTLAPPSRHTPPLERAAGLLAKAAQWAHALRTGTLTAPTAKGGLPLCMALLPAVLGTARIPRQGCDVLHSASAPDAAAVCRRGEWYSVPLFDATGAPLTLVSPSSEQAPGCPSTRMPRHEGHRSPQAHRSRPRLSSTR